MSRVRVNETPRNIKPWAVNIRKLRTVSHLTQKQVAESLNISQRVYADYELGNLRIPVDHLVALANMYNVSMDAICGMEIAQ